MLDHRSQYRLVEERLRGFREERSLERRLGRRRVRPLPEPRRQAMRRWSFAGLAGLAGLVGRVVASLVGAR